MKKKLVLVLSDGLVEGAYSNADDLEVLVIDKGESFMAMSQDESPDVSTLPVSAAKALAQSDVDLLTEAFGPDFVRKFIRNEDAAI